MRHDTDTSWESSAGWYDKTVGTRGHYYHQQVILPGVLRLLDLRKNSSLLDLACGQGILARRIPHHVPYLGVDASKSLISLAKQQALKEQRFLVHDLMLPLELEKGDFSHAACILAMQNIADPLPLLSTAAKLLKPSGKMVIVVNHPCFRIPRQSHWEIDEAKKLQYRRLDLYMSPLKIPIQTAPSLGESSANTWSFHRPLSEYTKLFKQAGFLIEEMEEWCSDKKSTGARAQLENRSRKEFPLFLTWVLRRSV